MRRFPQTERHICMLALELASMCLVVSLSVAVGFQAFVVLAEPDAGEAKLFVQATAPIDSVAARPAGHLQTPNSTPRRQVSSALCASEIWRQILTAKRQLQRASQAELYHSRVIFSGPGDRAPPTLSA